MRSESVAKMLGEMRRAELERELEGRRKIGGNLLKEYEAQDKRVDELVAQLAEAHRGRDMTARSLTHNSARVEELEATLEADRRAEGERRSTAHASHPRATLKP